MHFTETCISLNLLSDESRMTDVWRVSESGRWSNTSKWEQPFRRMAWQLNIGKNNVIRLGLKVMSPQSLHHRIFEVACQAHNGVDATLRLIQREFFGSAMCAHVESFVKNCHECRRVRFGVADTTHSWPKDAQPWSRIHMDWTHHAAGDCCVSQPSHRDCH